MRKALSYNDVAIVFNKENYYRNHFLYTRIFFYKKPVYKKLEAGAP